MKIINLGGKGSLLDQYISEIRDKNIQTDKMRFRNNLKRIGEIFSYEISKTLNYLDKDVSTPLGIANVPVINDRVVIATILRAGLAMHDGFLHFFDNADNAFIAGYRKYDKDNSFEIKIDYVSSPVLDNKILIINDAMLASGASFELSYKELVKNYGTPKHVHLVAAIASKEGIEHLESKIMQTNISLWTGAIDDELTVSSYIVPGLGDAGDLAYGNKDE